MATLGTGPSSRWVDHARSADDAGDQQPRLAGLDPLDDLLGSATAVAEESGSECDPEPAESAQLPAHEWGPRLDPTDHGPVPGRLPDPETWSRWLAQLLVEVVHGRRPAGQLARWTEERVLATVVLRTRQLEAASRGAPRGRPGQRPGSAGATAQVGNVRVQRPSRRAVEASAVIRGPRAAALAFRLEAQGDRWLCTEVDFGPQTPQPA